MKENGLVWVESDIGDPTQFDRVFLAEAGKVKEIPAQKEKKE